MSSLILHNNLLRFANIISQDTISNFTAQNGVDGGTVLQSGFESGSTRRIIFDLGQSLPFDAMGIAKHNLGTTGATIRVETGSSASGPWGTAFTQSPNDDKVIFYRHGSTLSARFIRFSVEAHSSDAYISNISLGQKLEIDEGQRVGFAPPEHSMDYELERATTRSNDLAGLTRIKKPRATEITIRLKKYDFFETSWESIKDSITQYPFYFLWDELRKPAYCWPVNVGNPRFENLCHEQVSIEVECYL